jgi:hypothetical protein
MSLNLRTTILATGCILALGSSAAWAQTPSVFYYPAPGSYATTQGTVHIPAAGYYYNVPLQSAAASANPTQGFTYSSYYPPTSSWLNTWATQPTQRSTYSYYYYPSSPSYGYYGYGVGANVLGIEPMSGSAYGGTMLMAPSGWGQGEGGASDGGDPNYLGVEPMSASAYGGSMLMAPSGRFTPGGR